MANRFLRRKRREFKKNVFNYFSQHLPELNKKIFKKAFNFKIHLEIEEHLIYCYLFCFTLREIKFELHNGNDGWWQLNYEKNKKWYVANLTKTLPDCCNFLWKPSLEEDWKDFIKRNK